MKFKIEPENIGFQATKNTQNKRSRILRDEFLTALAQLSEDCWIVLSAEKTSQDRRTRSGGLL